MAKSEIEKWEEKKGHLMDSLSKVLFGFIPGGHVAEVFLNYNQDLKNKRTLDFIEKFSQAIQEFYGEAEFNISQFTNEDFVDVFDSIILKVQMTKSEMKMDRFKKLLVNHTVEPIDDQIVQKFATILNELNDIQLVILNEFQSSNSNLITGNVYLILCPDFKFGETKTIPIKIANQIQNIEIKEIDFFVNDLVSKGLFKLESKASKVSKHPGKNRSTGKLSHSYSISEIGKDFLKRISN